MVHQYQMIANYVLSVNENFNLKGTKMNPFEVLITEDVEDNDGMAMTPKIVFGPKINICLRCGQSNQKSYNSKWHIF